MGNEKENLKLYQIGNYRQEYNTLVYSNDIDILSGLIYDKIDAIDTGGTVTPVVPPIDPIDPPDIEGNRDLVLQTAIFNPRGSVLPQGTVAGSLYRVSELGTFDSVPFTANDLLLQLVDTASSSTIGTDWVKIDGNDMHSWGGLTGIIDDAAIRRKLNELGFGGGDVAVGEITAFSIQGQDLTVNTGYILTGLRTFNFTLNNPNLFTGTLTLSQGRDVLISNVSPTLGSISITVNTETLANVGDGVTFTLSGENTAGNRLQRTVNINVVGSSNLVYYGISTTNNPATVNLRNLSSQRVGTGEVDVNTGTVADGDYFIILDPATNPIISITDDVLQQDVTQFFTLTSNVRVIETINYNSYVIGPLNADSEGENYTLMLR